MTNKSDWREFASNLTHLMNSQGKSQFFDQAFIFLNNLISVDSCAVFKITTDKITGAEHLCTFGSLDQIVTDQLARNYISEGFQKDPMVQTALISSANRVRHIPHGSYAQSYRNEYFETVGLIDKVTSLHVSSNALYSVNFHRLKKTGKFKTAEFRDLEKVAPLISRFVIGHIQLIKRQNLSKKRALPEIIDMILDSNTSKFVGLSNREREICKLIMIGHQEKTIADRYGISTSSVTTYRKRAYNKLEISSKEELFQMLILSMCD